MATQSCAARVERPARYYDRWGVWRVRCRLCGHEHVQVAPLSVRFPTECSACHGMACEAVAGG